MRIEKLNSDKVKVTLTQADLATFNIEACRISPDSDELHTFLFHIMEIIHKETGFNPYRGQVVVEATPSREGVSILVTRLNAASGRVTKEEYAKATKVTAHLKKKSSLTLFYFDDFRDLCAAIAQTTDEALLDGSLYKINKSFCFALNDAANHKKCVNLMSEFSLNKQSPEYITYVKEHGKLIANGKELVNMRENIKNLI